MTTQSCALNLIKPNPYQLRDSEDAEHIKMLAQSILENGLLQIPSARMKTDDYKDGKPCFELAFGHSRLAAYRVLAGSNPKYNYMPLNIVALTDQEMFQAAVAENLDRKDLSPIEEAKALQVYMATFGKTSAEAGKLFHMAESTVRNKVRLLDLPAPVQERISSGAIVEGSARQLLTLQKTAAPEIVEKAAAELATGRYENPEHVAELVRASMKESPTAIEMWESWRDEKEPRGGEGLWPLDWVPEQTLVEFNDFKKLYSGELQGTSLKNAFNDAHLYLVGTPASPPETIEGAVQRGGRLDVVELVSQLVNPPACTACPYYARLNRAHWCGLKGCHANKKRAWLWSELMRIADETGIRIYNSTEDGKEFVEEGVFGEDRKQWQAWFDTKDSYLRIRIKVNVYGLHSFTESRVIQLITLHPEALADKRKQQAANDRRNQASQKEQNRWELEMKLSNAARRFMGDYAVLPFVPLLATLKPGLVLWLAECLLNRDCAQEPNAAEQARRSLMSSWLDRSLPFNICKQGPVTVAQHLQGVAQTLGVTLPADWLEVAQTFMPDGVSVETV